VATKNGKSVKTDVVMSGRTGKIVVAGSQNKIKGRSGNSCHCFCRYCRLNGNHVQRRADNTIEWTLSGPGNPGRTLYLRT